MGETAPAPKTQFAPGNLLILIGFVMLKFFLQYQLIHPVYELHRDEFLHLDLGHHLAGGYASVPPFTAWISRIIFLLGNSVFWVKFFPALFGALTMVVVWEAIRELKGNLFALVLGATGVLLSAILRLNTLYQPNSFDILCWTTLYFIIIKYFNSEQPKWLFWGAFIFALGFLNKYNIVFLVLGFLPAVLLTGQRKIFRKKKLYLSLLLALVLILPNLLWQYNNDFPVVDHMRNLAEMQLVNVSRKDFLVTQILFFLGSLLTNIAGLYALIKYEPFKKFRSFLWAFFLTLAVFLYFQAKPYYAIGLYPVYIAFGAVYLEKILKGGWKRYLRPVVIGIPVVVFIPMFGVVFPNKAPEEIIANSEKYKELGMLRWEDGKDHEIPQDFADMLGWKELARKVDSVYRNIPEKEQTLVFADNYGQAGAINFYTDEGIKAVSFSADYINWFNLDRPYFNLIRIRDYEEGEDDLPEAAFFEKVILADSITHPYAREHKTRIYFLEGAKFDMNQKIKEEIAKEKNL
ncbi:Dolichyl-phosphate-mannose-protein mannosyltransferase [Salinimicrobium sediminis]|uniref:Dolichyl-phosphate-mannose-protein mannosyltransferase n=1 Tax=Salinimicrobium sediminis TaxID=1343891 RepID=A0A285X356_9FLAO|nr:glycosyltransferase family 39 protein [Salinimicrobium sediminis]SOC78809.1 Dolichyl-phosphate-mannose-protein mannosyltransferase [Salinimicrobium sediminis]